MKEKLFGAIRPEGPVSVFFLEGNTAENIKQQIKGGRPRRPGTTTWHT